MTYEPELSVDIDLKFTSASTSSDRIPTEFREVGGEDFNEHGVRKNIDEDGNLNSVDVVYKAMEAGPPEERNGVRITNDLLRYVASADYSNEPPFIKDHNRTDTFAKIGNVKSVAFKDGLWLMNRVPNVEGSQNHQEAISRFTHDPPQITDGSVGFGKDYKAVRNDEGEPELKEATLQEFSTTNFPGGYDDGGLQTAFQEAAEEASIINDDFGNEGGDEDGSTETDDGISTENTNVSSENPDSSVTIKTERISL